jgi:hypothetical protein
MVLFSTIWPACNCGGTTSALTTCRNHVCTVLLRRRLSSCDRRRSTAINRAPKSPLVDVLSFPLGAHVCGNLAPPDRRGFVLPRERARARPGTLERFAIWGFLQGVLRMPYSKRAWTEDDIAKLKSMAGKVPWAGIAAELDRSRGALAVEACELRLSLRTQPRGGKGKRRMVSFLKLPPVGSRPIAGRPSRSRESNA